MNSNAKKPVAAVVLAAGKGKRMHSDLPKVLHEIGGRPMIAILMETLAGLRMEKTVVVIGHKGELVKTVLSDYHVDFVWQTEQLGTAHAVSMARDILSEFDGTTLVCNGDVPFMSAATVRDLLDLHERTGAAATCLSAILNDPSGYGRIVRDTDSRFIRGIVEEKDASLFGIIDRIDDDNAQKEFYLTDAVRLLHELGHRVAVKECPDPDEVRGVNDREQLLFLEKKFVLNR
jgi:bifunctional N-acetylglucosamine-1-phosphate-uridyltransferase/glucosamine-1-phosphate-acetyltransferase GlmU-like protein